MLTVEKIGGTSMSALAEVIGNIVFFNDQTANRVLVVSAFSGVTNLLLENKKTKAPGVYHRLANNENFTVQLAELTDHLKALNRQYLALGLDVAAADDFIDRHVARALTYLESAVTMLVSGYLNEGILLAAREILASIGESHSAYVLANILQNKGLKVELVDLSGFDDRRALTISERIKMLLQK